MTAWQTRPTVTTPYSPRSDETTTWAKRSEPDTVYETDRDIGYLILYDTNGDNVLNTVGDKIYLDSLGFIVEPTTDWNDRTEPTSIWTPRT